MTDGPTESMYDAENDEHRDAHRPSVQMPAESEQAHNFAGQEDISEDQANGPADPTENSAVQDDFFRESSGKKNEVDSEDSLLGSSPGGRYPQKSAHSRDGAGYSLDKVSMADSSMDADDEDGDVDLDEAYAFEGAVGAGDLSPSSVAFSEGESISHAWGVHLGDKDQEPREWEERADHEVTTTHSEKSKKTGTSNVAKELGRAYELIPEDEVPSSPSHQGNLSGTTDVTEDTSPFEMLSTHASSQVGAIAHAMRRLAVMVPVDRRYERSFTTRRPYGRKIMETGDEAREREARAKGVDNESFTGNDGDSPLDSADMYDRLGPEYAHLAHIYNGPGGFNFRALLEHLRLEQEKQARAAELANARELQGTGEPGIEAEGVVPPEVSFVSSSGGGEAAANEESEDAAACGPFDGNSSATGESVDPGGEGSVRPSVLSPEGTTVVRGVAGDRATTVRGVAGEDRAVSRAWDNIISNSSPGRSFDKQSSSFNKPFGGQNVLSHESSDARDLASDSAADVPGAWPQNSTSGGSFYSVHKSARNPFDGTHDPLADVLELTGESAELAELFHSYGDDPEEAKHLREVNRFASRNSAGKKHKYYATGPDGRRRRYPRGAMKIGDLVSREIRNQGWGDDLARSQVMDKWHMIVGPQVAEHTTLKTFQDSTLYLECDSTARATQIRYQEQEILDKIAYMIGPGLITKLRIYGPSTTGLTWRFGSRHVHGDGPRDTYA